MQGGGGRGGGKPVVGTKNDTVKKPEIVVCLDYERPNSDNYELNKEDHEDRITTSGQLMNYETKDELTDDDASVSTTRRSTSSMNCRSGTTRQPTNDPP
jgi:hypothetical protein